MNSAIQSYQSDIREMAHKHGILSKKQEHALSVKIQAGDKVALNTLIEANLKLVFFVAKKYITEKSPVEELVAEGNIGLIRAAELFDSIHDCKFSTYAFWWIEAKILDYKARTEFSGSKNNSSVYYKMIRRINKHLLETGMKLEAKDIAEEFELTPERAEAIMNDGKLSFQSMQCSVDGEDYSMEDSIPDESIKPIEDVIVESEMVHIAKNMLGSSRLNEREAFIVKSHFGIGIEIALSFKEIGDILHVSNSRVGQLYDRAMRKLKYTMIRSDIKRESLFGAAHFNFAK